ncbi:response regulator [Azospirillum sp. TSO35-2]|uniref:response regulator n=1 Tax=Azospirillum sp. TSO35-2 TaxID=716796 RepID=UPI000D620DF6|nr:response regulator [Azospirillum sp. TSO35-2]PWC36651.1 regulator [Azospirillum sp. TSO35-2]
MAKILVVDDDPVTRNLIRAILTRDEHDVTLCAGAVEAIEALSFQPFDLLLTDIIMPQHDGFEVIQAARNLRPEMPVMILSAIDGKVPQDLTAAAFARLGVSRVIAKPINPSLLASEVLAAIVAG